MLKRLIQSRSIKLFCQRCVLSELATTQQHITHRSQNEEFKDQEVALPDNNSLLEPLSEDISHVSTYLKPTFNLAAYANKSEIIQEFIKLGVDLHYIETKIKDSVPFILGLKFDNIKDHILFFNNLGVEFTDIGKVITKNPFIFRERLDDLEVRVNYLKFKNFDAEAISRIISVNAFWLSYSTQDIDQKLGFFQKTFELSGPEVRLVAAKKPQLITCYQQKVKEIIFTIKEEMGFSQENLKHMILIKPAIFMTGQHQLIATFDYLHNTMQIPHEQILQEPAILRCRHRRLKERHQFLVKLKRDQFNPKKPNYINLITMVKDTDANFAMEVAKSNVEEYNMFLKTL
ncbi:transcription termination factor 3, mitochondrial [Anthonomus grandis grandis]|uniref:transcription termination factor 3, mitochondrial n=1 Tax=Anthonomus grandis grandis TaxID=2921223 RepID=UPI002165945D|nr:transcription termination factor 3, mitochondrial [Anthonomus grandis grandis]